VTTVDERRELTRDELRQEARRRFGEDPKAWAFVCPTCGDVATVQDFMDAGDADAARIGQECIGRLLGSGAAVRRRGKIVPAKGKRGCDWAAYGLFRGPWFVILPAEDGKPERKVPSFALAMVTP